MYLHEWLFKERMNKKQFSQIVETSHHHICRYISKKNKISRKLARQIERATKGEVTLQEILEYNCDRSTNSKHYEDRNGTTG